MKIIKITFVIVGVLISFLLHAGVIKFAEIDQDGHEPYIDRKICDINSKLEIFVDVMELKNQLKKRGLAKFPEELYNNISIITEALKQRNNALKEAGEAIELYRRGDFDGYVNKLKNAAMGPARLLTIPQIKQATLEIQVKKDDYSQPLVDVFNASEGVLSSFMRELDNKAGESGIYIQMGSWLITQGEERQIHLPGFDNIPDREEYVVPRWQFSPSEEEQKKFSEFSAFAKENKEKGMEVLKEAVKIKFQELVALLETELNQELDSLIAPFEEKIKPLKSDAAKIKQALETIKTESTTYKDFISNKVKKYRDIETTYQGDLTNFIISAENDVKEIISKTTSLFNTYETRIKLIAEELEKLPDETKQTVKGLIEELKITKIRNLIEKEKNKWGSLINDKLAELIKGRQFDAAALEFSDEVYKLDISNVPAKTEISMTKTGPRENGDTFVVKMVVGSAVTKKTEAIETRQVVLFMVLPHIRTLASLIFAKPTENGGESDFKMSPSYSILLKGFLDGKARRKSVIYNRIWDFSIGLNLASMDINNDNKQELGVGFVLSGIKDYFQIGYGYNLMEKEPYWFFGIRIPIIPVINLTPKE